MRYYLSFVCVFGFLTFPLLAENYYINHVAEENWTTAVTVYNDGPEDLTFDMERWDNSGAPLTPVTGVSVPANSSTTLTNADFGYHGTAMVVTPPGATLIVKLAYRYQDSHSLCEFFIPQEYMVKQWMLPNPYQSHFDWFGMAIPNFSDHTANVTVTAWHNGSPVATADHAIPALTKLVDVSSGFWTGINYADVDMVTIDSDTDIPAPLSITGNTEQDRHVFFLSEHEVTFCSGSEKRYAVPHVAESNWTTTITAYNNRSSDQVFTFSSWNGDGSPDVTDLVVNVPAEGSVTLSAGTDFVYAGTAEIVTTGCMHFKLSYRYGTSQSLCEFFLGYWESVQWLIPNSIHEWFNWFGLALNNPGDTDVTVTLDAYRDGQFLGTYAQVLAPHTKSVGLSSNFWPDISSKDKDAASYSDVDMVLVRSSAPIPKPLSITGNTAQDRHVFFLADRDAGDMDVPDRDFLTFLLDTYDTNHDGTLSTDERNAVTAIDTPGTSGSPGNIRSIEGVQMFPHLQTLSCCYEDLYWLPDLSGLNQLTYLDCSCNHVLNLQLDGNPNLRHLFCSSNRLTSLDVNVNVVLNTLDAHNNLLTSLDVNTNTELSYLSCASNQIASLDVTSNTALTTLSCYFNQLTTLDVSCNSHLQNLWCHINQLTDLDVSGNPDLESLYCYSNKLGTLHLGAIMQLSSLYCNSNLLTDLDVSTNSNLQFLNCSDCLIENIPDVTSCTAITYFRCNNNNFGPDDCPMIQLIEAMDIPTFVYNPQKDGSTLTCP